MPDPSAATLLPAALPVTLEVRGGLDETVRRTVEGTLGWQLVDEGTARLVPPAARLVDVAGVGGDGTPMVLLVTGDDRPLEVAEATARLRPGAVVAWPTDGDQLAAAVARATATPRMSPTTTAVVRIGGAAGGVGTTTVAAGLAAAAAWRGVRVLLASGDRVLLPAEAPGVEPGALAAPDLFARAVHVPGVPGLRAVRTSGPAFDVVVTDPEVHVAVVDVGVADDVDVLVLRPDAAGLAALGRTAAAAAVVVGEGAVPTRELSAGVGGRRRIVLPRSHRVARAAVVGRVPSALPGRFVRALLGLVPTGADGRGG